MRSFFRALDRRGVGTLLISGQACVLYGAAMFSEDIDIWVRPTAADMAGLTLALRDVGARAHKLTPPLELRYFKRGHGFHFRLPDPGAGGDVFLDIMGRPPRVGAFGAAARRARRIATPWGEIPVVDVRDLVLLKKTRRLADYDVITSLARIGCDAVCAGGAAPATRRRAVAWALENTFRADALAALLARLPDALAIARWSPRASVGLLAAAWPSASGHPALPPALDERLSAAIAAEVAALQHADSLYWRPVVDELRELRRRGELLTEGAAI